MPTEAEEQVRGVVRCRETFQREILKSRHFVLKFLAVAASSIGMARTGPSHTKRVASRATVSGWGSVLSQDPNASRLGSRRRASASRVPVSPTAQAVM